jgi:glucose/arabinose dehydrogenase
MRLTAVASAALSIVALASISGSALGAESGASAFRLVVVARGLDEPVQVTAPRSERNRLYVVEQRGTVRVIEGGKLRSGFFLDVRNRVLSGGEQGLLGLAFDPLYPSNRFIYVNFTDGNGDTRVVRFKTNGQRANPASARVLLAIDQPYPNHNGGGLAFGPDGYLYVGTGDGGSGGDPQNRAQSMQTLLGKMLRLDARRPGSAPEIVALGLRNPWRYSFDRLTGDLYIGDVGQGQIEEIDYTPRTSPGLENYGWDVYEGSQRFEEKAVGPGELVFPIFEYSHDRGCTVVGGHVYRGSARAAERGRYTFGDYCSGVVWSLRVRGGEGAGLRVEPFRIPGLTSFGENAAGELFATSNQGGIVYRIS